VCRVYDLGEHENTLFLTMQLLAGETLADRIRSQKRLPVAEALPIARQIAAAIDAAHRVGVVHRDLKPGNVMLLPPGADGGAPHVVVTDFGLARVQNDDPRHDLTLSGEVAGSPAYMAPEQVEGTEVGPLADIYAFGIILFEMVTGKRPFEGPGTISTASRRLVHPPPSPRSYVPSLDLRWERAILQCLARDPQQRFLSAGAAIAALSGPAPRKGRGNLLALGAAGALAIGVVAGGAIVAMRGHHTAAAAGEGRARSVAVIGFKNLAARPDAVWISPALTEMLATELAGALRAVPGQDVARARVELGIADADAFNRPTLEKIHANLGADVVIAGSYLTFGGDQSKLRLDMRVQDARSGETIATISEQGTTTELPDLVERAGGKLRAALGLAAASPSDHDQIKSALPANPEAARLYAEGVDKLHRLELVGARDLLEQAAKLEPDHPIVRAALAEVWAELGYDGRAREQAKLALDHAERLSPAGKLVVEARYHLAAKEWDPAIEAFRRLVAASPDDRDAVLQLAHAQVLAQRSKDALATLAQLHGDDPRGDLEAARAYSLASDLPAQRDAAARAAARADKAGATLLAARARLEQASALLALGDHDQALSLIDRAESTFKLAREMRGVAFATHQRALVYYQQGKFDQGDELEAKAVSFLREVGSVQPLARSLLNLGVMAARRADSKLAVSRFNEAIEVARSADDRWTLALALSGLGDTERLDGDLEEAKKHEAEALDHARATASKRAEGYIVQTLAQIALAQADLGEAETRANDALALAQAVGEPHLLATTEVELGRIKREAGDLVAAREHLEKARAAHAKANELVEVAIVDTELAELELAEGHAPAAVDYAQHAAGALDKAPDELAHALAVLARAQLAEGKPADAKATVARAVEAGKTAYPDGRIEAALAVAAIEQAEHSAHARQTLASARSEAEQLGLARLVKHCDRLAGTAK
jgi:tetratricopeptide (TPR) repeat protein